MNGCTWLAAAALVLAASLPAAAGAADGEPAWSGNIAGYGYALPDQPDFGVGVASVSRGPLRFEVRHNYEAKGATSAFIGWKFSGGDAITYELTPLAGVLGGSAHAGIAGLEASIGYKSLDFYTEAEYVADRDPGVDNYFYSWSELGWRPVDWLRVGFAGQRTRIVNSSRDIQLGAFAQVAFGKVTLSLYAFNPDVASRYAVFSVGLGF
jgi:hypothetical protein